MDLRAWTVREIAVAWFVGIGIAATSMWAARRQMWRAFDETQREIHAAGREYSRPPSTGLSSDPDSPQVRIDILPADSPEAVRMAKTMRRLRLGGLAFLSASIVVPLVLLVLTAWWAVLKLTG